MRMTPLLLPLVLTLVGCGKSKPTKPAASPGATPVASADPAGAAGDPCDVGVRRISAMLSSTDGLDAEIARCRSEQWNAAFLQCMAETPDLATYGSRCMKLLFSDADGLMIDRVFEPEASRDGDPPAGKQDGDLVLYSAADRCGFLTRLRYPGEAVYLVCGDTVFAGPLTTAAEIDDVSAALLEEKRQGHELRMGIMKRWPTFRTVRVYDATGKDLGTEVR